MIKRLGGMTFSDKHKSSEIDLTKNINELTKFLAEINSDKKEEACKFYESFLDICKKRTLLEFGFSVVDESAKRVNFAVYIPNTEYQNIKSDVLALTKQCNYFSIGKSTVDEWDAQYSICL